MTLKGLMKGILGKDLKVLGSGFWMILVLYAGEMKHSLDYFGAMGLVSYSSQ